MNVFGESISYLKASRPPPTPPRKAETEKAIILHCLPAHYGEEIDYATSRTPNSVIFDQAENRMHAQNALMVSVVAR